MMLLANLPDIAEFFERHPQLDRMQALYLSIWSEESVKADRTLGSLEIGALELEGVLADWWRIGCRDSQVGSWSRLVPS